MPHHNGGQDVHDRSNAATLGGTGLPTQRWSRELRDRAKDCDAAFEQLDSPSCGEEVAFAGTRDILSFAADQVDQTAETLTIVVELVDATDPRL